MMRKFVIAIAILFFPALARAQIIPLNGMSLRIVTPGINDGETPKTVQVAKSDMGWRVSWFALEKQFETNVPYPTYKVHTRKGTIEFDSLSGKDGLLHPRLWGEGYFKLTSLLPLWVDKDFLFLSSKHGESREFNIGVLYPGQVVLQSAPDEYFEKISQFQSLYNHFFTNGSLRNDVTLKRKDSEELEKFQREFFRVHFIAKTEAALIINHTKKTVLGDILGNDYYQLVVLEDFQNPLVLAVIFHPEKAPTAFQPYFDFFRTAFEYQVTQVSY
jgi:hypothetical protein